MSFIAQDLYLASGTTTLQNSYTDTVYKFDSSSFYNWEQDNLPIYDLEERDDLLFEKAGYPTSAVTGMMLTVSDCGVDNKKVFGTIEAALNAIPNTIRFPIIIEVAASGQLGEMKLENLQFEGSGAGLEIVNRGFAKALCGSGSTAPSSFISTMAAGASSITEFTSEDLSSTMTDSSALGVSSTVWTQFGGASWYWKYFNRSFILAPEWARAANSSGKTITISSRFQDVGGTPLLTTTANRFQVLNYTDNSALTDQFVSTDLNGPGTGGEPIMRFDQTPAIQAGSTDRVVGLVYANALTNIKVRDCGGEIYIRGFCVDGASIADITSTGSQRTDKGILIENSDVVIENCTVARCAHAGLEAVNSNVILNRGFIAFRNYELETVSSNLDTKTTLETAGLRAINSSITLSSTIEDRLGLPIDSPYCFYRNQIGIDLVNSKLLTPDRFTYGKNIAGTAITNNMGSQTLVVQSFLNLKEGIRATNSLIDTGQRISVFQNDVGINLQSSVLKVSELLADHNQNQGLASTNSTSTYNKDAVSMTSLAGTPFYPPTAFYRNGQHVTLKGSKFIPKYVTAMDDIYTRLSFKENFKVNTAYSIGEIRFRNTVPAVEVSQNSYMDAVASKSQCYDVTSTPGTPNIYLTGKFVPGFAFNVTDQSTLNLAGHKNDANFVIGPYASAQQQNSAGIYAGNNSKVVISGPTNIVQYGINALAEDNSTVSFLPHQTPAGDVDVSGFSLGNTSNHTSVQLHSTRACLVANNNSNIIMKNLGGYDSKWLAKYKLDMVDKSTFDLDLASSSTTPLGYAGRQNNATYYQSGKMAFYPNPYTEYGTGVNKLDLETNAHPATTVALAADAIRQFSTFSYNANTVSLISFGGQCIRAVGNSNVVAQNVDLLAEWTYASGAYYDASATSCELLRIWNIADNSRLNASYLSVNSVHPQETSATQYGPSAVWSSGVYWTILSGAPMSTPDTSSLSILDTYGLGVGTGTGRGYYGQTSHENTGAFRIYVSPNPKAKFLGFPKDSTLGVFNADNSTRSMAYDFPATATTSLITGIPYQLFAQGYSVSGDCSASPTVDVKAVYKDLGFADYISTLSPWDQATSNDASSFFYPTDMLSDTSKNIWLDDSAINTFANAKNGLLNTSKRKPIFSYYSSHTTYPGEASWNGTHGKGFGSASIFDTDRNI